MEVPNFSNSMNDVLGGKYSGFYWEGIPYKIPIPCSEEKFKKIWMKGWDDAVGSFPNCADHYVEPFKTIYGFAYSKAPKKTNTFRAIAINAIRESYSDVPF